MWARKLFLSWYSSVYLAAISTDILNFGHLYLSLRVTKACAHIIGLHLTFKHVFNVVMSVSVTVQLQQLGGVGYVQRQTTLEVLQYVV
jgi:hypothetical protein